MRSTRPVGIAGYGAYVQETISDRTGFEHTVADPLPVTPAPSPEYVRAIRTIDADGLRERLVG